MKQTEKVNGWNDGWHTTASTGDSLDKLRDSMLGTAKATFKLATTAKATAKSATSGSSHTSEPNGWSDDRHATANTRDSLNTLRQSAVETSKSTANMATTREGWWKIARGTGKVAAASVAVGIDVVRNALRDTDLHDEAADLPFGANPDHPLHNPHAGVYYDRSGFAMDRTGAYHDDDDI